MIRAEAWLDEFFAAYYSARPVNATFIGVHDHDHRLPDLTESGAGDTVAAMRDLLERCPRDDAAFDRSRAAGRDAGATTGHEPVTAREPDPGKAATGSAPPWHVAVDLRLARGYLATQLREFDMPHFRHANPSVFTGEAIFGVLSLFLTDFAPFNERVVSATARLDAVPAFLDSARSVIARAPQEWTQRAIRECDGALAFLEDGLPRLLAGTSGTASASRAQDGGAPNARSPSPPGSVQLPAAARAALVRAADAAAAAFARFREWLDTDLRLNPHSGVACGEDDLDLYIRQGHFLDVDASEIERYAVDELRPVLARLAAGAAEFGADSAEAALAELAIRHPPVERYLARYDEILAEVRGLAGSRDLVTWPDFPIRFVPRPAWARKAAPFLYFLFYRSPAAVGRPVVHEYLVEPIEATMPPDEQERRLRSTNDSVMRLNHVIHHGGIGHHVQNWHAFRSASRVGRIAAVDCASRIAMFCGGTMAEGWACYATDLMAEHGMLSPLERYAELRSRARMCARAIVDVRLHEGRFSLAEAARFYQEHAGMSAAAAHSEAVKNSMFPGAALMYLVGTDRIRELRGELSAAEGDRFSLRGFHDTFLSFGSIPVSMSAALMTGRPLPGGEQGP